MTAGQWITQNLPKDQRQQFWASYDQQAKSLSDAEKEYCLLRANGMDSINALKTISAQHHMQSGDLDMLADNLEHTPIIITILGWLTTIGVEHHWVNPARFAYSQNDAHTQLAQLTALMLDHAKTKGITASMAQAMIGAIRERDRLGQITIDNEGDIMPTIIITGQEELK